MEANQIVKVAMKETKVSLEELAEVYGISKQAMSQRLKNELPNEIQVEYRSAIIAIAEDRIRKAVMI